MGPMSMGFQPREPQPMGHKLRKPKTRDRQWTDLQGESREGGKLRGGLAGQWITLHRKKFYFLRLIEEYIISPDPPPPTPSLGPIELLPIACL